MKTKALIMSAMITITALTSSAFAQETRWDKSHPRRDQVNDRLHNQNSRIHQEVKEGDMSHRQAANLHRTDNHIRTEERRMASRHNGHITSKERTRLNRQENRVSRRIGN